MAPQDTGRLGTPVGPLGTPDGLPPSTAGPAPLKPRVRPSSSSGPFRPFWVSCHRLRSPPTPEGVFLTLSTQGGGSVYAAFFRGASQPGPLGVRSTGSPTHFLFTLPISSRLLFSVG